MPCERKTRTMLAGKHILLLGNGEDSTSELGLKLTLHGGTVFVIGHNKAMLAQLQHEVHDIGGHLDYGLFDSGDSDLARLINTDGQSTHHAFDAVVDNTGQPDQHDLRTVLDALERSPDLTAPAHIITISHTNNDAPQQTVTSSVGNRSVVIQTAISDQALPCATDELPAVTELYAAILAREVTYALGDDAYLAARRIVVADDGDDILARLYDAESTLLKTIRRGRTQKVYIAATGDMGRAVFAGCDFKRGNLIFEINGTRLDHQTEHTIQIDWNCHLEPDSPIRLMNHSCDPNVGVKTNANGLPDFYAFRDIQQGDELNFDYAMTEYTHYPRTDEALEFSLKCRCGSSNCRGKLGYYAELPETTKRDYTGFVSAYFATPKFDA